LYHECKSRLWRTIFIENTYAKVQKLKALITRKRTTLIEVDGGVTKKNASNFRSRSRCSGSRKLYLKLLTQSQLLPI
jgi:hypothetical protein